MRRKPASTPITDALRSTIHARRLSARAVATMSDVDPRVVGRWLNRESVLSLATADRIAAALGMKLVELASRRGKTRAIDTARADNLDSEASP